MDILKAGDLVVLRSGGPLLTVVYVEAETALVGWFNSEGAYCQSKAACAAFKRLDPSAAATRATWTPLP